MTRVGTRLNVEYRTRTVEVAEHAFSFTFDIPCSTLDVPATPTERGPAPSTFGRTRAALRAAAKQRRNTIDVRADTRGSASRG